MGIVTEFSELYYLYTPYFGGFYGIHRLRW